MLALQAAGPVCGPELGGSDTGDAGAVGVIMVVGTTVIGLAFWGELRFVPTLWVHEAFCPAIAILLVVLITRPVKVALVAAQFRHRPSEMGL
jgi:uncharacterized protein (DUF983 family)